jgi:putative colanic acid biosynthesis UDP-glucose lipid carrier transferase
VLGLALKLTVGAGIVTDTVADCDEAPPGPVQVSV